MSSSGVRVKKSNVDAIVKSWIPAPASGSIARNEEEDVVDSSSNRNRGRLGIGALHNTSFTNSSTIAASNATIANPVQNSLKRKLQEEEEAAEEQHLDKKHDKHNDSDPDDALLSKGSKPKKSQQNHLDSILNIPVPSKKKKNKKKKKQDNSESSLASITNTTAPNTTFNTPSEPQVTTTTSTTDSNTKGKETVVSKQTITSVGASGRTVKIKWIDKGDGNFVKKTKTRSKQKNMRRDTRHHPIPDTPNPVVVAATAAADDGDIVNTFSATDFESNWQ